MKGQECKQHGNVRDITHNKSTDATEAYQKDQCDDSVVSVVKSASFEKLNNWELVSRSCRGGNFDHRNKLTSDKGLHHTQRDRLKKK